MALASSPAAAPPMPSATINKDPRGPMSWLRTSGWRLALPVLRSATRNVSSLCSRVRPRSVLPKTETRTEPLVIPRCPSVGSRTFGVDEFRERRKERQRRLGVTCSQCVPCSMLFQRWLIWPLGIFFAAPASARQSPPTSSISRGPITVNVVYPAPEDRVRVRDSSFLLGSVSGSDVQVTINGNPVRVWPNGAWLAWLPFPADSVIQFRIEARRGQDST